LSDAVALIVMMLLTVLPLPGELKVTLGTVVSPACVTVTVWPATVSVFVRPNRFVLTATLNATVPLPVPLLPDVIEIQDAFGVAVHPHVGPAVTVTLLGPPGAPNEIFNGETL
jgi:hypothetical protein